MSVEVNFFLFDNYKYYLFLLFKILSQRRMQKMNVTFYSYILSTSYLSSSLGFEKSTLLTVYLISLS